MRKDPIYESPELEELLALLETTFKASQASFLDKLHNLITIQDEGLLELADRFDENAIPLLAGGLITKRDLTLTLRKHIPIDLRKDNFNRMRTKDPSRKRRGLPLLNKKDLIRISQEVEMEILEVEAEMRGANQVPLPRSTDPCPATTTASPTTTTTTCAYTYTRTHGPPSAQAPTQAPRRPRDST